MRIVFLTPLAALVALAAAVPVAAAVLRERRDGRIRRALGLAAPSRASRFGSVAASVVVVACLSAAAAQPAVRVARPVSARTDAQAFFVVDVSRSMSASASPRGATRLERATTLAVHLRRSVPAVPAGLASMTDRVLPHLFPTPDERVFVSALHRSIGIGRPAAGAQAYRSTQLESLGAMEAAYFGPVPHRLAILLTDGESDPFDGRSLLEKLRARRIGVLFVRVWSANEAIYGPDGKRDPGYRPDRSPQLATMAPALVGGRIFDERSLGAAESAVRRYLGRGPEVAQGRSERMLRLGQYAALAAALPLLFLLRRNRG